MRTKLGSTKIIFIDRCVLIFKEPFILEKGQENKKQKNWNSSNRALYYNIIISVLYTLRRIFIFKKFSFLICQFVFDRVLDPFKEFIISYFARVICCDSTNVKWISNHIGMTFQVINAFSNPVNNILPRWQSAIQIDNQQYKQKNDRCHERRTEPPRWGYKRINSKPK